MKSIKFWLLAFRPKTLTAAVAPILASVALVSCLGYPIIWWIPVTALMASLFIQIATNLVNDAKDFKKGADTEERLGPKRVTAGGVFTYESVMRMAFVFFGLAVACGIPLVLRGGTPIFVIGIASLVCGYAYTGGPFPLAYRGLGDIFVVLFFGVLAVSGMTYLLVNMWFIESFVLGLQIGLLCAVLIAINNLRDIHTDKKVNKRTLAVRLGVRGAKIEIALLVCLPYILGLYWWSGTSQLATLLPLLSLPLAVTLLASVFSTEPSAEYNRFLGKSAALHMLFTVLIYVGLGLRDFNFF